MIKMKNIEAGENQFKEERHEPAEITAEQAKKIFIKEMSRKAKQIGLIHSNFVEPAGFPSTKEQIMTVRDMLKMMIYASSYEELAAIWNKKSYTMNIYGSQARKLRVQTTVKLPAIEAEYEILGGKTGEIWGTNEIDGFHIVLLLAAQNGKRFAAALRGASSPANRAKDLKIALDNAMLLAHDPNAKVQDIASESAAVCVLPAQTEYDMPFIYAKNADVPGHPASITKIMTAIIALGYLPDLDEKIVLQQSDMTPGMGDFFLPGDIMTIRDLFYGMMLPSSNTCATAVARITGERMANQVS